MIEPALSTNNYEDCRNLLLVSRQICAEAIDIMSDCRAFILILISTDAEPIQYLKEQTNYSRSATGTSTSTLTSFARWAMRIKMVDETLFRWREKERSYATH